MFIYLKEERCARPALWQTMAKKRIAYVLHGLAAGGTESFIINTIRALDSEKYSASIILALDEGESSHQFREDEVEALGVKIYRTNDLESFAKKCRHYRRLKAILLETGPYDILHSNMDLFNGVNLLAAKRVSIQKRISHSHSTGSQYAIKGKSKWIADVYHRVMRMLIRQNATLKLGCSEVANDYLYGKNWRESKDCHVVYNGIDLERFQCEGLNKAVYRKQSGLPEEGMLFVAVARICEVKNPIFALRIIKALHDIDDSVFFSWVGDGDLKGQMERFINENRMEPYVKLLGRRSDIPELLKCNDAFLQPSIFEGLPIATIEAQAAGLICFGSDKITTEVDCGLCEFYSLDEPPEKWAAHILDRMKERGRTVPDLEARLRRFDIKNTILEIEGYYDA